MIYDFCNTYTIQKYCAVEANSLSEAIEKVKLSGSKFERRNDKETLINSKYRYVNDWIKENHYESNYVLRKSRYDRMNISFDKLFEECSNKANKRIN